MNRGLRLLLAVALLVCGASVCTKNASDDDTKLATAFDIDKSEVMQDLKYLTAQPHPLGSSYQKKVGDYLLARAKAEGATAATAENFTVDTPNPDVLDDPDGPRPQTITKSGRNIAASVKFPGNDCWLMIGSHYDTKVIQGLNYVGANDSGSSSVLLLQMLSYFRQSKAEPSCDLLFVWFDGEESVLTDWHMGERIHPAKIQDNTYGSRFFVDNMNACGTSRCYQDKAVLALVLLDMVGMPDLTISLDSNSSPALRSLLKDAAADLGLSDHISSRITSIEDDHVPFVKAGIPSLNMINFQDLSVWHRDGDELSAISTDSIKIAGQLATLVLLRANSLAKDLD